VLAASASAGEIPLTERRSGYDLMSRETRAMQDDDTANPGMLWVLEGESLWNKKTGDAGRACAECHGEARASMTGVAARHPAFDAARGRPVTLEQRVNLCRADRQKEPRLAPATAAWLSHRDPRGTLRVRRRRAGRPRAVLDVAGARDAVRSAGCAALKADHGRLSAISSAGRPRPPIGTTIYCFSPAK